MRQSFFSAAVAAASMRQSNLTMEIFIYFFLLNIKGHSFKGLHIFVASSTQLAVTF